MTNPLGIPSLKEFMDAMGVAWPVAAAICLGSSAMLVAEDAGIRYAAGLPTWLTTTLFFVAVFSGAVCLVTTLQGAVRLLRAIQTARARSKARGKLIERLYDLPQDELFIMSYLCSANTQAFPAELAERRLVGLIEKGLIIARPGQHSMFDWPHVIPEVVWKEMRKNAQTFHVDCKNVRNPLINRW